MVKVFVTFAFLSMLISNAMAKSFVCEGRKNGKSVVFKGVIPSSNLLGLGKASGSVLVGGKKVMSFTSGDLEVSYISRTFETTTNQGDVLEGKVRDLIDKTGIIYKLLSPSYGIALFNISVQCR